MLLNRISKELKSAGRSLGALFVGALSALIGFGLLLGLAWLPRFTGDVGYKTVTLLLVAGISFLVGGYVSGRCWAWSPLAMSSALTGCYC